jgi:hypothetical protein
MGFNNTATTISLTAKLTPVGRQLLVSTNNSLITSFSLGDSDANYIAVNELGSGQVPSMGGEIGPNSTLGNGTNPNINFRSVLVVNSTGSLTKPVEKQSTQIINEVLYNGVTTVSGSSLTQNLVNRDNYATDPLVNLFYSFGLPLTSTNDINYTGVTYNDGGFSDTALSGLAKTNILVMGIDNASYGELIDGKTINLNLPTTAGTYSIYSTYENKGSSLNIEDANLRDTSLTTQFLGDNIALLFSDSIMKPNGGDSSLSWGTGYNTNKPFSNNGKQLYNLTTNSNIAKTADTVVGIAYLDKGFLVITDSTIINNIGGVLTGATTASTVTFNSVSTSVHQSINCIAARGEFGASTNVTFTGNDIPRFSEVGLYDTVGNLIAVAKTDRQINKNINEFLALSIKITL